MKGSHLPRKNIIQEIKNRFLNENLDQEEPPDLGLLAIEYGLFPKDIYTVANRNNWIAYRNINREKFLGFYEEAHDQLIKDAAIDKAKTEIQFLNRTLHFIESNYESLMQIIETRKSTMSDKDLLAYIGMVLQAQQTWMKMEAMRHKGKEGLDPATGLVALPQNTGESLMDISLRAELAKVIGQTRVDALPATLLKDMDQIDAERSVMLAEFDKEETPLAEFSEVDDNESTAT